MAGIFKGWEFRKVKGGGANEAGEFGGVYASTSDPKLLSMIKQEKKPEKNISEFLGSKMFEVLSPGYGAKVSLVVPNHLTDKLSQDKGLQDDGSNVYVRSEFFKNYRDMYVDMDKHMHEGIKPSKAMRKDGGRPLFMGTREWLYGTLTQAFNTLKYKGFEKIAPASLLIGDFDMHVGNIGVVRDPKVPPRLVRIDFAGSLDKLEDEIHPLSTAKHLPLIGPTNHYKEFPKEIRNTKEFADSLISTSKINLDQTIDDSFKELQRHYSNKVLANWAKMSMPGHFKNIATENITVEDIKGAMKKTMSKRQESLKEYGIQIKLTLAVSKDKETGVYKVDEQKLKKLIKEHKEYFKDIIAGKKAITLQEEDKGAVEVLFSKIKTVMKSLFPSIKILSDKNSSLADRTSIVTEAIRKRMQKDARKAVEQPRKKDARKAVEKLGKKDTRKAAEKPGKKDARKAVEKLGKKNTRKAVEKLGKKDARKAVEKLVQKDVLLKKELQDIQRKVGRHISTGSEVAGKNKTALEKVKLRSEKSSKVLS